MIGTISHGTLRTQDLIPSFLDTLAELAPEHHEQMFMGPFGPIPAYAMEDQDSDWWNSEDASSLLEELEDLLNDHAPEFCYFGTSEGDGSDFGFWPDWEAIAYAARDEDLVIVDDLSSAEHWQGQVLVVNDHGNATLYDADGSEVWGAV